MARPAAVSFGLKTTPANVGYEDIRRVWLEADEIPEIEHAWLYDHLVPWVGGPGGPRFDPAGFVYEGWTLLSALAAQTRRLRLGLVVTNNRIRLPAVLAKMAATVDVISGGRLDLGIGIGGLPDPARIAPEYEPYGIPHAPWPEAVASFAESLTLIRRLWTDETFDFDGIHHRLRGAHGNPRPVQRPHPPILVGGTGRTTLRLVAEHADIWNAIGPPLNPVERLRERSVVLDGLCAALGRDPAEITRSVQLPLRSYDDAATSAMRENLRGLVDAGFTHLIVNPPSPYPTHLARWIADELITPTLSAARNLPARPPR